MEGGGEGGGAGRKKPVMVATSFALLEFLGGVEAAGIGGGGGEVVGTGRWKQHWPMHQLSCCILEQ